MSAIYSILLTIDGAIYDLISSMFTIFNFLAKTDLFSNDLYGQIVRRMYVILGMIMMFALAYSLLKAVINPDEFSKGENSFPKLIKNVVISLGIIAVLPTVFTVAFNIQNSILNYDTIPKLVLGEDYNSQVYQDPGRSIAFNTYSAFLHVNEDKCEAKSSSDTILTEEQIKNCGNNIVANTGNRHWYNLWLFPDASSQSFTDVVYSVNNNNISFANFNQFSDAVTKGEISYIPVVSTICGLFLLYVLVNFCFDMAVRVVKLMFFQIIAPIPVVCRVIPGGKMKDVFSTWTKKTISTFIDVFIRIFIMYIGVFVIKAVIDNWDNIMLESNLTSGLGLIAKALIIMGVIIFIRQAPKLLADMFHLDAGDMKLGIMDKLAAGGALTAAGALGGGAGMLLKNGAAGVQAFRKTKGQGFGKRLGSAAWGALSTTAGTLSGAARGLYGARGAKNWGDVKKSSSSAIATASLRKEKRDNYRAAHTGANPVDTLLNVSAGHIMDNFTKASQWMGFDDGLSALQAEKDSYKKFLDDDSETDSAAVDLMGRAAISQNALIMQAAGGPKMAFDAMKEVLDYERKMPATEMIGKTVTDFKGDVHQIKSVNDYANYLSIKKAQLDKSERDLKKYIKRFGYQENSIRAMTIDVATNDILTNTNVASSRTIMHDVAKVNYSADEMSTRIASMSRTIWDDSMKGTNVVDFNGQSITLNSESDFSHYKEVLKNQASDANAKLREYITNLVSDGKYEDIRNKVVADGYDFDVNKVVKDLDFGDGEVQRINKIHSYSSDVRNIISENPIILERLNSLLPENKQVHDINGPDAWDKMDKLINNIKDRNININTEINRLLREKEGMSGDNNKKS